MKDILQEVRMPCNAGYGWCQNLETVYRDDDKEYCVFHAPQGKKRRSAKEFNALIWEKIESRPQLVECDLSGIVFDENIDFKKKRLLSINFYKAQFCREADFSGAQLTGMNFLGAKFFEKALFTNAQFSGTDFTNAQFSMDTDFSKARFDGNANFGKTHFNGLTDFEDVQFSGGASFWNAKFDTANFMGTQFGQEVDFKDAQFNAVAAFVNSQIRRRANFGGVRFNGEADFRSVRFGGVANFWQVKFNENALFQNARFDRGADFWGVQFIKESNFGYTRFKGDADFTNTQFSVKADFTESEFAEKADFLKTVFGGLAYFGEVQFKGLSEFSLAQFGEKADFSGAQFGRKANFRRIQFSGEANFSSSSFNEKAYFVGTKWGQVNFNNLEVGENVRLESVDIRKVSFLGTDIRRMDFIKCDWPLIKGSKFLYDEALISGERNPALSLPARFLKAFKNIRISLRDYSTIAGKYEKVEILYRGLKQKYKEEHNEAEASIWHFREKEMWRKRNLFRRFFPFSLSNLYWLSSGYGERVTRAGLMLFVLLVGLAMVSRTAGLELVKSNTSFTVDPKNFVAVLLNTAEYAAFIKAPLLKPVTLWGEFFKFLTRILVPIQAALLFLAIRNRFRR